MAFALRRNRLTTLFSERIPVVKRRMTVTVAFNRVAGDSRDVTFRTSSKRSKNCDKFGAVGCVLLRLPPRLVCMTLEDGTAWLSRNDGKELPLHAAY